MNQENNIGLVMIHGAGLNTWIWDEMLPSLNHPSLCIAFPNREKGKNANHGLSLETYIQHAADQINHAPFEYFILVTHSIGGCVGALLSSQFSEMVIGLVGMGAAFPKKGGTFNSCLPFPQKYLMPFILRILGTQPPDEMIRAQLCNDLNTDQTKNIVSRFSAESRALYTSKVNYRELPEKKLYVKLLNDQAFYPAIQQSMIENMEATQIEQLNSGHLPMLSQPAKLATILNDFADHCNRR